MSRQLEPEDLEEIQSTRRQFTELRTDLLLFAVRERTGIDPVTDEATYREVELSIQGVVQAIEESDRLLRLGGKLRAGDLRVTIGYRDASHTIGLERLPDARVTHRGRRYRVELFEVQGLGRPNRVDLGLVPA